MNRRNFLQLSGSLAALSAMPRLTLANDGATGGDTLVCVFLRGGADSLNLIVPAADPFYYDLRPTLAIAEPGATGGAIDLNGFFALHPALEPLKALYDTGNLAIVPAAGSPHETRSHFDAEDYMELGYLGKDLVFDGWLNRHMQLKGATSGTFSAVGVGARLPTSLHGSFPAVGVGDVESFSVLAPDSRSLAMEYALRTFHSGSSAIDVQANAVFDAVQTLEDAGVSALEPANGAEYPDTAFGNQLAGLATLIRSGVGVEVAGVELGGWDHHDQEAPQIAALAGELAQGLSAFYADLGAMGSSVSTVTMTEFGRRGAENASAGTDHGHASFMMVVGGGVNGGQVYGEWPGLGLTNLNRGDLEVTTDFRSVLSEILIRRRGETRIAEIFPEFQGPTAVGLFA